jgi:hypothetical protein
MSGNGDGYRSSSGGSQYSRSRASSTFAKNFGDVHKKWSPGKNIWLFLNICANYQSFSIANQECAGGVSIQEFFGCKNLQS